ncbi:putative NAD binding Rossmann fold oxidoreductase [Calocera viscosa TUFC12733]|uniref:Putative NAD binding Rossmann fold oxidoreductase n=1 Tax=Calocera viscosa (strain TUFC12733) TaxID=1330018 RepID=A0A167PYA6_CALVF|nr:putative NAD binding Rossmann fold oxidoreductase [Calocera viscosa TUFC12733]
MSAPVRAAVLGTGLSATVFHIPFILAHPQYFALHSILERSATPDHSVARQRYGPNVKVVTTYDEVLTDKDVDVVVLSTPNSTHYPYAKAALEAGKHVIIEKPLTTTSAEGAELVALAARKKLLICVYQNRRWDSDFLTLRKLLAQDVFGEVVEFETRYDRFRPNLVGGTWKEKAGTGQGALFDLGSHLIDQVLTLFGTPSSVTGFAANSRQVGDPAFDDSFVALFHYPVSATRKLPLTVTLRGAILSLLNPQLRFTVKGTRASWVKYGLDVQEPQLRLAQPMSLTDPRFGVEPTELEGTLTTLDAAGQPASKKVPTERGDYTQWYKNVGQALQAGDVTLLEVKPEQGLEVIKMIEAIYTSSREGRTVSVA